METIRRIVLCKLLIFVFFSVFLYSIFPASAQVTFTNNEAQFVANNPGLPEQDFEDGNVTPTSFTECGLVIDQNTNDDCFSPGDILPGIEFLSQPPGIDMVLVGSNFNDNPFNVLLPNSIDIAYDIAFPNNNVNAVGVDLGCLVEGQGGMCSVNVIVQVFGAGDVLLGSTTEAVTSMFDTFLGIRSSELITRINIETETGGAFEAIERISFGMGQEPAVASIPTLSEWGVVGAVAGLMLAGVFFVVWRKKGSCYGQ
jgi:hypothetical protein